MRRSICYCDPTFALAGEVNSWKFIYTTAAPLPKGTLVKFDANTLGRPIDWEIPDSSTRKSQNVIYLHFENGKSISANEIKQEGKIAPLYEFTLNQNVEPGESITVVMGAPKGKDPDENNGNRAQCMTQRRRNFFLSIDTTGKGVYADPEVFTMDIRGNVLHHIQVLVPSYVNKNKRFDIIARFEDAFGNLTSNAPMDTLIELSYENIRENLNWKLFIPETGFITLPNLYFNEAGIYTVKLTNLATGESYKAPPVKCFAEDNEQLFWGTVHGESDRVDSAENIESCLRHFRDEKWYNFYTTSPFEGSEETSAEMWKLNIQNVSEFDEADRFTTFLGFQWVGARHSEGLRQFVYAKDNKPLIRRKELKSSTLKKIYKSLSPKELISIPSFTMAEGTEYNFANFDPEFERVVEIYNAWGSSEMTKKQGNRLPISTKGKTGVKESPEGAIVDALKNNCRFGFVAGGLDDRGVYSRLYEGDQEQYSPGLTAIIAPEQSRSSMFDALYRRSCYATTGERMIVGFNIAGTPMGGEITTAEKPGLRVNRHISGYAAGTANIHSIEIIRNGEVLHTIEPNDTYHADFEYDDLTPIEGVALDSGEKKKCFLFYYIRVNQVDGHTAWASPIWIDIVENSSLEKRPKRTAKPGRAMTAMESFGKDLDFALDDEEEVEEESDDDHDDDDDI